MQRQVNVRMDEATATIASSIRDTCGLTALPTVTIAENATADCPVFAITFPTGERFLAEYMEIRKILEVRLGLAQVGMNVRTRFNGPQWESATFYGTQIVDITPSVPQRRADPEPEPSIEADRPLDLT